MNHTAHELKNEKKNGKIQFVFNMNFLYFRYPIKGQKTYRRPVCFYLTVETIGILGYSHLTLYRVNLWSLIA